MSISSFDVADVAEAARSIVEAGRFLYQQGWSPATSSNYSQRISDQHVAITVSGRHKGQLADGDVMVVDLQGNPVQSRAKPSAETLLHTVLYELYPEAGAVLHTHSIKATVLNGNISMQYNVANKLANLQLNNAKLRVQTGGKTSFFYDV